MVGVASLFIELADDPDKAPSDGPNMLRLDDMEQVLSQPKKLMKSLRIISTASHNCDVLSANLTTP